MVNSGQAIAYVSLKATSLAALPRAQRTNKPTETTEIPCQYVVAWAPHRPVAAAVRQTGIKFGKPKRELGIIRDWVSWVDSSNKYPAEVTAQLLEGEHVEYFSYIAQKGGCLTSSSRDEHWIALTNKRMFYKALVRSPKENQTVERDGLIPLEKISFVEVTSAEQDGCSGSKSYHLKLGSSGGEVSIPIPTREKGVEVRGVYARIHDEAST